MQTAPPTIIYRHRRENLKKCSLRGLERYAGFQFYTYPRQNLPNLSSYLLLDIAAPPLSIEDVGWGLFLIDATWRLADVMLRQIPSLPPVRRSLPPYFRTAYPRRQEDCQDPLLGLASIEALYLAYHLTGRSTEGLLDHYHWKDLFLTKNHEFLHA